MVAIVPHRDIELKLINAQKKIIKDIFDINSEQIPYAAMPLWIQTDFESVEEAKNTITKVTVLAPEYDDEQGCPVCPVEIKTVDGIVKSKLNFISELPRRYAPRNDDGETCHCERSVAIQAVKGTFPLPVKIFRLGECTSPKPGVFELSSTMWKKTT